MKEDKVYPAIYESTSGAKYLYIDENNYWWLSIKEWGSADKLDKRAALSDKNITRKYLANTYGEVESKEHAEFIIELAKNADFKFSETTLCLDAPASFMFYENYVGIYGYNQSKMAKLEGDKPITIPMPPKEVEVVDEWPMVDSEFQHRESKQKGVILCVNDNFAWCKYPCMNPITVKIKDIEKPKTPEEEFYDDIVEIFSTSPSPYYAMDAVQLKYNITKKQ